MSHPASLIAHASPPLAGRAVLPGDKSISHRALLFAALAAGRSEISGLGEGADVLACARALQSMGVGTRRKKPGLWEIDGPGIGGLTAPARPLDCGNSGTAARLLAGVLAGHAFPAMLVGDESLSARPMARMIIPLRAMGADLLPAPGGRLPLRIEGRSPRLPCDDRLPVASAQVKAGLLFAALHGAGESRIEDPFFTRDHSERMLPLFGGKLAITPLAGGGERIEISGPAELTPAKLAVPADPSAAAFAAAACALIPGSEIILPDLCLNPRRFGFYRALAEMGVEMEIIRRRPMGGEEAGDVHLRAPAQLKPVELAAARAPAMIDEYPALAMAAAAAHGQSRFCGIGELQVKESDRLAAILAGLEANGIAAKKTPGAAGADLVIEGGRGKIPGGGEIAAGGDHRMAMSFAVLGLAAEKPVAIAGAEVITTSFPDFIASMGSLGARLIPGG